MKPIKALTLILALSMLMASVFVMKPVYAANPVSFDVYPSAFAPLTDINASAYGLETPNLPPPTGQFFNVSIHMTGATVGNVAAGVAGVEVHFDFSTILAYAKPLGFQDLLGQVGGVLNPALLYGITARLADAGGVAQPFPYTTATQYIVAAASTGAAWNAADGIVANIQFAITGQPSSLLSQPDFYQEMDITFGSAVDGLASAIPLDLHQATLHIDTAPPVYPKRPEIFIDPPSFTGSAPVGTLFNYTVMIKGEDGAGVSGFWDIAGFDVKVTWNNTLINLVAESLGGFLQQGAPGTFGFDIIGSDNIEMVYTKLSDPVASSGTDSLMQLQFQVAFVGTSFPAETCPIGLAFTDLASWAHPERTFGPWFSSITAVDLPYDPAPTPPALAWTHVRVAAMYTAPYVTLGPNIDLYTQYPDPFGGQGANQHSDSFAPQQEVCLFAKVTFGGDRVTNKLVSFEVDNALGQKVTILQNYSDINGIAEVCFRIPQTDLIPGGEDPSIFGWWHVIATVELDQVTVNDTLDFQVGWLAQVTGVVAVGAPYLKYSSVMNFTATLMTIHEQPIWVLVSVDSYDVMGYPIGETAFWVLVNATRNTCPFTGPTTTTTGGIYVYPNLIQGIPTWTRVGTASVIGYALTDFPKFGGTPWGPQSPTTLFSIKLI